APRAGPGRRGVRRRGRPRAAGPRAGRARRGGDRGRRPPPPPGRGRSPPPRAAGEVTPAALGHGAGPGPVPRRTVPPARTEDPRALRSGRGRVATRMLGRRGGPSCPAGEADRA